MVRGGARLRSTGSLFGKLDLACRMRRSGYGVGIRYGSSDAPIDRLGVLQAKRNLYEKEACMDARLDLLVTTTGHVPIALSYWLIFGSSIPVLLGLPVEGTDQTHVFRAIMGLYVANALFWSATVAKPDLQRTALWVLFLSISGLAAGCILSIFFDGVPKGILLFYLAAAITIAALAAVSLKKRTMKQEVVKW
nr:DUF4345 domain-containing protein [Ruegeria lacuscaerulensis]